MPAVTQSYGRPRPLRVAIVHHWIVERAGGEKVIESLLRLYPNADVYTNMYRPRELDGPLSERAIRTTLVNLLPYTPSLLPLYVPLMPAALARLDLRDYDLVISNESGPSKGVRVGPQTVHVCYCQSPMRYVWDMEAEYLAAASPLIRPAMRIAAWYLRKWDRSSAKRLDLVIANSRHTQERVRIAWQRDSIIVHPPVEVDRFAPVDPRRDHFVFLGRLVPYKRADLAVKAANHLGRRLVVIGDGPEMPRLKRLAGGTIEFLGRASHEIVSEVMGSARALLFPGEEDFGIVPVEAMAAGVPVIAFGRGGALDTVVDGVTGILHDEQTVESIAQAIRRLDASPHSFPAEGLRLHAKSFSFENWAINFRKAVDAALEKRGLGPNCA